MKNANFDLMKFDLLIITPVKPVHNDHPQGPKKWLFLQRFLLFRGPPTKIVIFLVG